MARHYVISTFTNDMVYPLYEPHVAGQPNKIKAQVVIKGGANRADERLVTPKGVVTVVDDAQMEILNQSPGFKRHVEEKRLSIRTVKPDGDRVAEAEMQAKDGCAPLTPNSPEFQREDGAQPAKEKRSFASRVATAFGGQAA